MHQNMAYIFGYYFCIKLLSKNLFYDCQSSEMLFWIFRKLEVDNISYFAAEFANSILQKLQKTIFLLELENRDCSHYTFAINVHSIVLNTYIPSGGL